MSAHLTSCGVFGGLDVFLNMVCRSKLHLFLPATWTTHDFPFCLRLVPAIISTANSVLGATPHSDRCCHHCCCFCPSYCGSWHQPLLLHDPSAVQCTCHKCCCSFMGESRQAGDLLVTLNIYLPPCTTFLQATTFCLVEGGYKILFILGGFFSFQLVFLFLSQSLVPPSFSDSLMLLNLSISSHSSVTGMSTSSNWSKLT